MIRWWIHIKQNSRNDYPKAHRWTSTNLFSL